MEVRSHTGGLSALADGVGPSGRFPWLETGGGSITQLCKTKAKMRAKAVAIMHNNKPERIR
jgi:hypothetical protein